MIELLAVTEAKNLNSESATESAEHQGEAATTKHTGAAEAQTTVPPKHLIMTKKQSRINH
jgi:hypothetical protein